MACTQIGITKDVLNVTLNAVNAKITMIINASKKAKLQNAYKLETVIRFLVSRTVKMDSGITKDGVVHARKIVYYALGLTNAQIVAQSLYC